MYIYAHMPTRGTWLPSRPPWWLICSGGLAPAAAARAFSSCVAQAVFYAWVGKGDNTKPPKIVGSRYSDIGVARIVREDKLQQGVFDTTELIGLNWSEVHMII